MTEFGIVDYLNLYGKEKNKFFSFFFDFSVIYLYIYIIGHKGK